jgi:hypothetical protein
LFVLSLFVLCGLSLLQSSAKLIWWFCFTRRRGGGGLSHNLRRDCKQAKQHCVKLWHSNNISFLALLIMFVSFLSFIFHLFACCLRLVCSSSYPCPLFFLPSHPCLCLFSYLSKSLLLCAFSYLSLVFLYSQEKRIGVRNQHCLNGFVSWLGGKGRAFLVFWLPILHGIMFYGAFYSLYGFVCLDFTIGNRSYKFVTSDVVCTCAFS